MSSSFAAFEEELQHAATEHSSFTPPPASPISPIVEPPNTHHPHATSQTTAPRNNIQNADDSVASNFTGEHEDHSLNGNGDGIQAPAPAPPHPVHMLVHGFPVGRNVVPPHGQKLCQRVRKPCHRPVNNLANAFCFKHDTLPETFMWAVQHRAGVVTVEFPYYLAEVVQQKEEQHTNLRDRVYGLLNDVCLSNKFNNTHWQQLARTDDTLAQYFGFVFEHVQSDFDEAKKQIEHSDSEVNKLKLQIAVLTNDKHNLTAQVHGLEEDMRVVEQERDMYKRNWEQRSR